MKRVMKLCPKCRSKSMCYFMPHNEGEIWKCKDCGELKAMIYALIDAEEAELVSKERNYHGGEHEPRGLQGSVEDEAGRDQGV